MHGYYPLPRSDSNKQPEKKKAEPKVKAVKAAKQLELPGLRNSAPKPKTIMQQAFDLIEKAKLLGSQKAAYRLAEITLHGAGYAEPGYKNPVSGVVACGNWNSTDTWDAAGQKIIASDKTVCELSTMLEELGVELEWSDEWTECGECGKLCRTSGDSYHWKRCYSDFDGVVCVCCIKANKYLAESYLAALEGDDNKAVTLDLNLAKYGYKKVNGDFENGWHDGQDDNPKAIGAALRKLGIDKYIFNISGVGQFDIAFEVYVHKAQFKKYNNAKFHAHDLKQHPSPAENLSKALSSIPPLGSQGEKGIVVSRCHGDGTASSRVIMPQEFVEGKALA